MIFSFINWDETDIFFSEKSTFKEYCSKVKSDNSKSFIISKLYILFSFYSINFICVNCYITPLIYAINRMLKHEEIQYLEVDELTNDNTKFIHSLMY